MLVEMFDHLPVGFGGESLFHDVLSQGHVYLVALSLHYELARNVTEPAGRAGEGDLPECIIDHDALFDQGSRLVPIVHTRICSPGPRARTSAPITARPQGQPMST